MDNKPKKIVELPDDILQLVCDALLAQRDFATLYNCAVSCKRFAPCALSDIYRIYNETTDDDEEAEGMQNVAHFELTIHRWAIKWRAVALSALDESLFPYYRYLRFLDLRDLSNLVGDERFRGKVEKKFFSGPMAKFRREREIRFNPKKPARKIIDVNGVVEALGDAIIPKTDTLEQISGLFPASALQRWVPHLPRLQKLELYMGRALMGEGVQHAIYQHCPHVNSLSVGHWIDPHALANTDHDAFEADTQLGAFMSGLPSNSLIFFENIWKCGIAQGICSGLAHHPHSLKEFKLCIEKESIPHLALLRDCTNLERIKFEIAGTNVDENAVKEEDLREFTAWLRDCHRLQSIESYEAQFAPTLLTPVLQNPDIQLDELRISANRYYYAMKDNRTFHQALALQKSLTTLSLFGDATEVSRDDNSILLESICQLQKLRYLTLRGVSEYFNEDAVTTIIESLPALEELWIQGLNLGDRVLDTVARHPSLQIIQFIDLTSFTFEGLLGFVQKLDQSKTGFELVISFASNDALLSDEEVEMVRTALREKVGGRLEYQPSRDADADDFSVESD